MNIKPKYDIGDVDLLKEAHGVFNDNLWGNYDVTVDEIIPIEPEIILESWNEE